MGPTVGARYADIGGLVPQGISAEMIADKWGLSREDLDRYSAESQRRAAQASSEGRFENEIVPVTEKRLDKETKKLIESDEMLTADEGIRPGTTAETLANLKPAFKPNGKVTAGNSSQITDGASAVLVMSEDRASALGLTPRARFHAFALAGADPVMMLTAPIPATQKALTKSGLRIDEIGAFEVNEAFAVQVLAFLEHFGIADDDARVNPYGGAIAMGHPLASSGVRLMTQLARQFEERPDVRYGLTTMCIGIGMGGTVIWENPHWVSTSSTNEDGAA